MARWISLTAIFVLVQLSIGLTGHSQSVSATPATLGPPMLAGGVHSDNVAPQLIRAVWKMDGNERGALFGDPVASAGDVNADGYDDLIVGASCYGSGQRCDGSGAAFLDPGSPTGLSTTAAWTGEGDQPGARYGISVASAGDVNGDGYDDVVVGAYAYTDGQTGEGAGFLYLGSPTGLSTTAAWTAEGNQAGAGFGRSIAGAGDVNGDGYDDVVVGAWEYADGQDYEGAAFLYLGSPAGLSTKAAWTGEGNQAGAAFGISVASAGDVNGDGYDDVIVGAYEYADGQAGEGAAFLYQGSNTGLSVTAAWTGESNRLGGLYGISVASAGDVNGDGYDDVIVGADGFTDGQAGEGAAFLYLGSASGLSTTAAWTGEGNQDFSSYGQSVATAGDVNGDGYDEVMVGAYLYENGQRAEGRAFLYLGSPTGLSTTAAWIGEVNQVDAFYGGSVASAGDNNGDGFDEVIVGASDYDNGQRDEGAAFVYRGRGG